jgi:predicted nuclease of predicted toxin-antitoxin system
LRILADENVEPEIIERLRNEGHDVEWISDVSPGTDDDRVMDLADAESRVLLTQDKDFGKIAVFWRGMSSGVALLRLRGLDPRSKANLTASALEEHAEELTGGRPHFVVVEPGRVRVRPMDDRDE